MQGVSGSRNCGQDNTTFKLKLRYDGRIDLGNPPKYVAGSVKWISDLDYDEWGIMTLWEKVEQLGYKRDEYRCFAKTDNGLTELVLDLEAWNLVNSIVRPKVVEIWVIVRVDGEDESAENESDDEEYQSAEEENDSVEDELENFEGSDCEIEQGQVDDQDFLKYIDPEVEYTGDANLEEGQNQNLDQRPKNSEVTLPDAIGIEGNLGESVRPNPPPELPSPLWLGRTFLCKEDFKDAVKTYAIQFGKELKFMKNDKVRCVAICTQSDCKWQATCRKDVDESFWRVTVLKDVHANCPWVNDNKFITSSLVAKRWKKQIGGNSNWKMSEFRETVCTDEHHSLSTRQAYKALDFAKRELKGELEDNFNKIWSYCLEIQKTNPKTTCLVKLSDLEYEGGKKRFLRMYMCWDACRDGFKYCRPLIGVDGCHIKDKAGGVMLTAIGIDGNEGIFPIAYAIVEGENKDSWCWFLDLLCRDLDIDYVSQQQYTFMSDKQKGLIPAFEQVMPMVSHRFCVRHLHSNMKVAGFGGIPIRDSLWKAARATTMSTFSEALRELKALDVQAFQWLIEKHPAEWSRSHFSTNAKSDMLVNNISESFNAMILDARDSPLIHCLEIVRKQVMLRLFECRKQASQWTSRICPVIAKKISFFEKQAGGYWAYQSTDVLFEVKGATDQHQVDIGARTCSCRHWDLTGIPCRHAICALWVRFSKAPLHEYVDDCYTVDNYKKAYSGSIHPMAGPKEWPYTDREPPLPPLFTTKVGRPRKLRKKFAGEVTKDGIHISRRNVTLHCSTCKLIGHNTRRCPQRRNRAAAPAEVPVNLAATTEGDIEVNVAAADGDVPVNVAAAYEGDVEVNVAAADGDVDENVAAAYEGDVEVNVAALEGEFLMDFQQQQMVVPEEIHLANLESLPAEDTQVDPLLSVGDNIQTIVDDANSQVIGLHGIQGEGMTINSHGVKTSFGQPPKRRKIIPHSTKGKEVGQHAPPSNAKTHKSLGMTKSRTAKGRKYMTRSSVMLRSKFFANEKNPIEID